MTALVLSLPASLILLVHLHILEYPHANKSEYDHNVFNSQARGLRDRIKTLEDVCYFLVGRLEGNARTVLPTYPCVQPSDTVAFRTSLAKYLETLRHQSVYPSSKASAGAGGKVGRKVDVINSGGLAWWWKDVLVRKSLLEECSGEKFERLILSVSTHVLLKGLASSTIVLPDDTDRLLRTQPDLYTRLLYQSKFRRLAWSRSAALLLQRQDFCKSLREHLISHNGVAASKYSQLETERLVSLVASKVDDLCHKIWGTREGRLALELLTKLYGLTGPETSGVPHANPGDYVDFKNPTMAPQPLPIAAAHHPANLKKLRKPVFSSTRKLRGESQVNGKATLVSAQPDVPRSIAEVTLSGYLDSELRTQRAMVGALAKVQKVGQELINTAKIMEGEHKLRNGTSTLAMWLPADEPLVTAVNFDVKPTPELLSSLSLHPPFSDGSLESQIDDIRDSVLPSYPLVPDLFGSRLPHNVVPPGSDNHNSKIPRPNSQNFTSILSRLHAVELNLKSQPITSTPSAATKGSRKVPLIDGTINSNLRWGGKVPRKSIRFSLAINSRPSLFSSGSDEDDAFEDEIHRIVHGTEDESMENILVPVTPKARVPPVNRIFTGTRGSTTKRPKQSYPMALHEPSVALPSLIAASTSLDGLLTDSSDEEDLTDQCTPSQKLFDDINNGNETYENEGPSMTLRDILLRADTTQFDLLDDGGEDGLENESFGWD